MTIEFSNYQSSIILASASPRREQLLAEAGYEFTVFPPDIDESAFLAERINPCEYAKRLALAKGLLQRLLGRIIG